jgi:hypothetical protein
MSPLLHKYGFNCHTGIVWLQWLTDLTLDSPKMTNGKFYIHLRSLNVSHFKKVEATGLKFMASRSPLMA